METPPNILGILDDHWFRWIGDFGNAGPDKGQGGKFLILPPGYTGEVPKGYFVMRPATYGVWAPGRGFLVNGDPNSSIRDFDRGPHCRGNWLCVPIAQELSIRGPLGYFLRVRGLCQGADFAQPVLMIATVRTSPIIIECDNRSAL
jgi:hypothetical protein